MASMLQRIATAAACALLLACPASAQLIGSGHVMGNGTSSPAAPTDTQLLGVINQTGSGIAAGVGTVLGVAPNISGGMATLGAAPVNGNCASFNSLGKIVPAGGACTVGAQTCPTIETFGGGTGVPNNATALSNIFASFPTNGGCGSFGAGKYTFTSAVAYSYPTTSGPYSVTVEGVGQDATILYWSGSTSGLQLLMASASFPSFHLRDMSITTGSAGVGNGFSASFLAAQLSDPPTSDITNVTFRADNIAALTNYWSAGILLVGVSNVNMNGINIIGHPTGSPTSGGQGVGITVSGDVAISSYGVIFNISESNFQFLSSGFLYGSFIQGVTILNSNINFNSAGISVPASETGTLAGLQVIGTNLNNYSNNYVAATALEDIVFSGDNFILFANDAGIVCNPCEGGTIIGNNFSATSTTNSIAISVTNHSLPLVITGNTIEGMADAIITGSTNVATNVQSNGYIGNTANIVNGGTITAGNCSGIGGTCTAGATP